MGKYKLNPTTSELDMVGEAAQGVITPAAHKATHAVGGNDALSPADIGAVGTSDSRLSDSREWSAPTATEAEATQGTSTERRAWTPVRVFQSIASWWNGSAAKTKLDGIQDGAQANVATNLSYDAATRNLASSTGSPAVLPLFGSGAAGLVPAGGSGTTKYLREDGTFAEPPGAGGSPGGSNTQIQFNDGGTFGGDVDLTYNKTTNLLTSKGDILLDDGRSFTTTLQTVAATANRTISFPDATGTVALVGGSSGQVLVNTNGAVAGLSTLTADSSGNLTLTARLINAFNSLASAPAKLFSGTWFTGGTSTTTKPHVLIEPAGTTSNNFNTAGTGFGVNAPAGFLGDLAWLGVNGTKRFSVSATEAVLTSAGGSGFSSSDSNGVIMQFASISRIFLGFSLRLEAPVVSISAIGNLHSAYFTQELENVLSAANLTKPQAHRIYNTRTSLTNFERGQIGWSGGYGFVNITGGTTGTIVGTWVGTFDVGQRITGTGIPANTTITAVVSGTLGQPGCVFTLSQACTNGNGVGVDLYSDAFRIGTEKGTAGGTARAMEFQTDGITRVQISRDGFYRYSQPAPAAVDSTATLTVANLQAGIITTTTAAAVNLTLPTGTNVEGGFAVNSNGLTMQWSVINTGSNGATVLAATDHTLVGSGVVAAGSSGRFATRRTAANTYVTYRLGS